MKSKKTFEGRVVDYYKKTLNDVNDVNDLKRRNRLKKPYKIDATSSKRHDELK